MFGYIVALETKKKSNRIHNEKTRNKGKPFFIVMIVAKPSVRGMFVLEYRPLESSKILRPFKSPIYTCAKLGVFGEIQVINHEETTSQNVLKKSQRRATLFVLILSRS